jgi:hypothetical protein
MSETITLTTRDDVENNDIVIEVRVPRNLIAALNRREFADTLYDLMVAPLDLAADTVDLNWRARKPIARDPITPHFDLPGLPDDWRVLWCTECFTSVIFDLDTMLSYGHDWDNVLSSAISHEH